MASRNQNRPPRSPSHKKVGSEELFSDKRRRIGADKMERQGATGGRIRTPFSSVNNRTDTASEAGSAEPSECDTVEFTKEDVAALLNEKMKKGNPYDNKKKMEQMTDLIKRLKLCVRWFKKIEEGDAQEKQRLGSELEAAQKKCNDIEIELKNMMEELNKRITDLEERIAKEESDKLEADNRYREEKEARNAAEKVCKEKSAELERIQGEKSAAERKANSNEDLYKRSQEYNMSLQQYNSRLQSDLEVAKEAQRKLETEKATAVESLSLARGHNKILQNELATLKASQSEALNEKEKLANELKCLREELKQIRDDRDCQQKQVKNLTAEVAKYKEFTGESCKQLDSLIDKTNALEDTCSSQRERIFTLEQHLATEREKLKMADMSVSETRTVFEDQKRIIRELQDKLADKESQIVEGEKLRKKLHNTILELKGNIRVFCRVRPLLPDDGTGTDMVVSYPTSTESLGRGIELVQNGQKYPFTFDKVFHHDASQNDVFLEISQLV
ncbi:hypothetical protein HN873_009587 [Arachis hypogaea]